MKQLVVDSLLVREAENCASDHADLVRDILGVYQCAAAGGDAERFEAAEAWLRALVEEGRLLPWTVDIASAVAPVCSKCGQPLTPGASCE